MLHLWLILCAIIAFLFYACSGGDLPYKQPGQKPITQAVNTVKSAATNYREENFSYAMDYVAAGQAFAWKGEGESGSIVAQERFISKSHVPCRRYVERHKKAEQEITFGGIACKRQGSEGWCRLKEGDLQSCALESPANPVDKAGQAAGDVVTKGGEMWRSFKAWLP